MLSEVRAQTEHTNSDTRYRTHYQLHFIIVQVGPISHTMRVHMCIVCAILDTDR